MTREPQLTAVARVRGEITANILKTHLEAEGIPVLLRYESVGRVYGITANGLGQISVMVPKDLAETALQIIQPDMNA